jgi:hypothetical protein
MCDGSDIKPVTLGKGVRHTGFDLRGKARKNGKSRGDKRSNSDSCKSFDHDGPHVMEPWWPPISWLTDTKHLFPCVFALCENGFIRGQFCFVAGTGTKQFASTAATVAIEVVHRPMKILVRGGWSE